MPELPEVETICRGLAKALIGKTFCRVTRRRKDLRFPIPARLDKEVAGRTILSITRRAKYIMLHLEGGMTLLLHLGMSGRLVLERGHKTPEKHDHILFYTSCGQCLRFNDPRRFGMVDLYATDKLEQHRLLRHLGPEPLQKGFSPRILHSALQGKKQAIKLALMDQRLVVGVGNIYASEALFLARINPARDAGSLSHAECARLVPAIRRVLRKAIAAGGSSLRDYVQADGALGHFQNSFAVYGRTGERCRGCTCKTGGIRRIVQGGRATFYCPHRQK